MTALTYLFSDAESYIRSIRISLNNIKFLFQPKLIVAIFIMQISFLLYCCNNTGNHLPNGIIRKVPYVPTWKKTFDMSTQYFRFGCIVKAGFDFDNDGFREFAAFDTSANKLIIFENISNNTFEYRWGYKFSASILNSKQLSITTGDLNSDGLTELIVIADLINQPGILIWQNEPSSGEFLPESPNIALDPPRDNEGKIKPSIESLVRDFDNDKQEELLILYNGNKKFVMAIGSVEPSPWDSFLPASLIIEYADSLSLEMLKTGILKVAGVGVGDLDQNGSIEIIIACEGEKGSAPLLLYTYIDGEYKLVKSWRSKNIPVFSAETNFYIPIVDFNNDGKLEAYLLSNPNFKGYPKEAQLWVVKPGTDLEKAFDTKNFTQIASLDSTRLRGNITGDGDNNGKPDIYAIGLDNGALYQIEYTSFKDTTITNKDNYVSYKIYHEQPSSGIASANISGVQDLDGDGLNEIIIVRGNTTDYGGAKNSSSENSANNYGISVLEKDNQPASPTQVVAQRIQDNQIELNWKDNSNIETEFKINLINTTTGSTQLQGSAGNNVRHFMDNNPPPPNVSDNIYNVVAYNNTIPSSPNDNVTIPGTTMNELSIKHTNGLVIGDLGGSGIGWSDFRLQIGAGKEQDVLYRGFLLLWSKDTTPSATTNIYAGDINNFITSSGNRSGINLTTGKYEYTHAATETHLPVIFHTNDNSLTISQFTFLQPDSNFVIALWAIKSNTVSDKFIKFAMHLDGDTGGERSVLDLGGWDQNSNMIYQENYETHKTLGISHVINSSDLSDVEIGSLGGAQLNSYNLFDASARGNLLDTANASTPYIDYSSGTNAKDHEMTLVSDFNKITQNHFKIVVYAIAVGNDILELKNKTAQAKNYFLNNILEHVPINISQQNANGFILLTNQFLNSSKTLGGYRHPNAESFQMTLKLFNVFGEISKTLSSQKQGSLYYPIDWQGDLIPPGLYIYNFEAKAIE